MKRYEIEHLVIASPAFWKDELYKELKKKDQETAKKVILATCNSFGKNAINEILQRAEVKEVLKHGRVIMETNIVEELLGEIKKGNVAVYGIKQTKEAAEVGAKVQGRKNWLWIFITTTLAFFCFSKKREGKTIRDVLGDNYKGIVGCDGYKPYEKHAENIQRCWAHLLREAKYLAQKHKGQAQLLHEALRKMLREIKQVTTETTTEIREKTHDKLLKELNSWTQTCKAHTELRKFTTTIKNGMKHWFTCILHPEKEPTTNKAERGLRESVVQRKITGTLRNDKGTTTTQTLLTAIATWKIRGLNTHSMLRTILSS